MKNQSEMGNAVISSLFWFVTASFSSLQSFPSLLLTHTSGKHALMTYSSVYSYLFSNMNSWGSSGRRGLHVCMCNLCRGVSSNIQILPWRSLTLALEFSAIPSAEGFWTIMMEKLSKHQMACGSSESFTQDVCGRWLCRRVTFTRRTGCWQGWGVKRQL